MSRPNVDSPAQLGDRCAIFSTLPERYLFELEGQGAMRTYALDKDESLTLRGSDARDAVFLIRGEAEYAVAVGAEQETVGRFPNCKPIDIPPDSSLTVTAMGPILVCRADRDRIDFLISWTTLIDNLHPGDEPIRSRLAEMNNPTLFMHLPFENVMEAFRRMEAVPSLTGEDIVRQGGRAIVST
jgi:hypothetical protein